MCTVSFYMIDTNLEGHVNKLYANRTMNEMFGVRTDNVSYVQCLDIQATRADIDVLKTYVEQQEGVVVAGYFSEQYINDLIEEAISIFVSDVRLVELGNLKLNDELRQAVGTKKDGKYQVLLGCNYKDKVKIGDTFTMWNQSCVVAGFLEKGAAWPRRGRMGVSSDTVEYDTLNNSGILLVDDFSVFDNSGGRASELYFITEDGVHAKVTEDLKEFSRSKQTAIKVVNIKDMIQEMVENAGYTEEGTFTAAVLLTILAVVSVSASATIMCLINRKQYGVMMVCGVRQQDIGWIIVMQNALYYILGAIAAWIISRNEAGPAIISGGGYMVMIMGVIGVVALVISCILPLRILSGVNAVEMLHEK